MDQVYRRHLPHQVPAGVPIFLTWNLKGSLPKCVLQEVQTKRQQLEREPVRTGESPHARKIRHEKIVFGIADRYLNRSVQGPLYLQDPRAALVVVDSILFGAAERYDLYAYVVMGNHAHVLLTPRIPLARITQGIKGFTSRIINQLQGQQGRVFWQDESYDHWVRDEEELFRIIEYIERNPVDAALCALPEDWPWSSAARRGDWPLGQPFRPPTQSKG